MKITSQSENGRLVIDGEGYEVRLSLPIPGESPCILTNFNFYVDTKEKEWLEKEKLPIVHIPREPKRDSL